MKNFDSVLAAVVGVAIIATAIPVNAFSTNRLTDCYSEAWITGKPGMMPRYQRCGMKKSICFPRQLCRPKWSPKTHYYRSFNDLSNLK